MKSGLKQIPKKIMPERTKTVTLSEFAEVRAALQSPVMLLRSDDIEGRESESATSLDRLNSVNRWIANKAVLLLKDFFEIESEYLNFLQNLQQALDLDNNSYASTFLNQLKNIHEKFEMGEFDDYDYQLLNQMHTLLLAYENALPYLRAKNILI